MKTSIPITWIVVLSLVVFIPQAFASEPRGILVGQYAPVIELLPDTQIEYGESFVIHVWLATYDRPDELQYFVDVVDEDQNHVDSTLWSVKQDFVYVFDTTHPSYNITDSGMYIVKIERGDQMQRTGIILQTLEFEITKPQCRSDLFLAFRTDGSRTACVTPYTLDKLIERGWAKIHTSVNILDVDPPKESISTACPKDMALVQGGYYTTKDSTLTASQKRFDRNGLIVEFSNPEQYKQHAYIFVDCVTRQYVTEPELDLCIQYGGNWLPQHRECEKLEAEQCDILGGEYSECESGCRHLPADQECYLECVGVCYLDKSPLPITSFEECAAAGNPIMESYPRQCRTPDGKHFVEEIG